MYVSTDVLFFISCFVLQQGEADKVAQNHCGLIAGQSTLTEKDLQTYRQEMEYRERMGMLAGSDPNAVDQ